MLPRRLDGNLPPNLKAVSRWNSIVQTMGKTPESMDLAYNNVEVHNYTARRHTFVPWTWRKGRGGFEKLPSWKLHPLAACTPFPFRVRSFQIRTRSPNDLAASGVVLLNKIQFVFTFQGLGYAKFRFRISPVKYVHLVAISSNSCRFWVNSDRP